MQALLYIGIIFLVVSIWFFILKRPIYESFLITFIVLLIVTNTWSNIIDYIDGGMNTSLIYAMIAFVAMSQILTKTKIIDNCVMIILSIFGRVPGGAGYVSVAASSFMGALSGSGPGNVMATGTITIPAMKKSGFPAELAANIESASSYLGNMIPPSANIVAALGALAVAVPTLNMSTGTFWVACWGCSIWFILSRVLQVFAFTKIYKVKAMKKEDVPRFKETLKKGWTGLFLPVVILLPFILDSALNSTFFTERLGASGAKQFSSSLLIFVAGIATIFGIMVSGERKNMGPKNIVKTLSKGIKGLAPTVATCIFGYMIGAMLKDLNVASSLNSIISSLNLGKVGMCFILPLIACVIGMIIPGSSSVVMFGPLFITLFMGVGVSPVLTAAMLPCIFGVMCGITPPFALGMYAGMSIAQSDFKKTFINNLWWVAVQYIMEVIVMLGLLPILGV